MLRRALVLVNNFGSRQIIFISFPNMNRQIFFKTGARCALLSAALLVSSCMLGPNYERPQMDVPAAFRSAGGSDSSEASIADLPWWKVFKNKDLQNLISDSLENNKDLKAAIARCEQAREAVTITQSPMFPWMDYNGGLSKGANSAMGQPTAMGGTTTTAGSYGAGVSWQLDLWGKVRRQTEAATAQYLGTEEARRAIMLSLVGQVSMYYLQLIELDEELAITKKTVVSFEESLKLFREQMVGGISDILQVSSAEAALAAAAAQVPLIETQIGQMENAISILTGRTPGSIKRSGGLDDIQSTVGVPSGMPCDLLNRRPDLRQAEQALRTANANVGVAITDYFPSFNLTSSVGQVSGELSKMNFNNSASWGIGANMTGPLFRAGALNASERQAKAAFMEAKSNYEKTMLTALGEVSNSLIERKKLVDVISNREQSVKSYTTAISASRDRFKIGLSNYYEVLQAQQNLFPVEIALSQSRLAYAQTIVKLYTALGGGWGMDNEKFKRSK